MKIVYMLLISVISSTMFAGNINKIEEIWSIAAVSAYINTDTNVVAQGRKIAVFDMDETLVARFSTEQEKAAIEPDMLGDIIYELTEINNYELYVISKSDDVTMKERMAQLPALKSKNFYSSCGKDKDDVLDKIIGDSLVEHVIFVDDTKICVESIHKYLVEKKIPSSSLLYKLGTSLSFTFAYFGDDAFKQPVNVITENFQCDNDAAKIIHNFFKTHQGEQQQSSFECSVCFGECGEVINTPCQNTICYDCCDEYKPMIQEKGFVYDADNNNSFSIDCPACNGNNNCVLFIKKDQLKEILGREAYNNIKERHTRNMLEFSKQCPTCQAPFFDDDINDNVNHITCANCLYLNATRTVVCTKCFKLWEKGHRCVDESNDLGIEYGDDIKPCPNPDCSLPIQKNEGCLKMTCGRPTDDHGARIVGGGCGAKWCWNCGCYTLDKGATWCLPLSIKLKPDNEACGSFTCRIIRNWWSGKEPVIEEVLVPEMPANITLNGVEYIPEDEEGFLYMDESGNRYMYIDGAMEQLPS